MPDYIYRHKNSPYWQYDFVFEGRRFSGSTKTKTKQVAKAYVKGLRDRIIAGDHGRPVMTLGQGAQGYWATHGQDRKASAWIDATLARVCEGLGSKRLLRDLGTAEIGAYLARRRLKVGPATANRDLTIIRALWRFCAKRLQADTGGMPDWTALRQLEPAPRRRVLRPGERERLLEALPPDLALLLAFCLATGARVGSARRLRWADVDEVAGTIVFPDVKSRRSGETHHLPVTATIAEILALVRGQHDVYVFTYLCRRSRGARMAGRRYPFSKDGWRRTWNQARSSVGLADLVFHDARRTAGAELLRATGNLKLVQRLLGHADIATTAAVYTPMDLDDLAAGMASMSRTIPGKETATPESVAAKSLMSQQKGTKRR